MSMEEGMRPGYSADFHPENKIDPLEVRLEKEGDVESTFDELMVELEKDPNNPELRRQANLLVNRLDDLSSRLREKVGH